MTSSEPTPDLGAGDYARAIVQGKAEISADLASGRVPRTVRSFSDLHSYVDANEYAGFTSTRADWDTARMTSVVDALDRWLADMASGRDRQA